MLDKSVDDIVSRVKNKIHRIRLQIHPSLYRPLLGRFRSSFDSKRQYTEKEKKVYNYHFAANSDEDINAVILQCIMKKGPFPKHFVCVRNPTIEFQKELQGIIESEIRNNTFLRSTHPNHASCVYDVESALDFHPKNSGDLDRLFHYLASGLFLKRGRRGEHLVYSPDDKGEKLNIPAHPTLYIGKKVRNLEDPYSMDWDISVYNDLHGLRLYYRPYKKEPEYIRFEYVSYKNRLEYLGLRRLKDFTNISAEEIRPLEFVTYRRKNENRSLQKVLRKKKGVDGRIRMDLSSVFIEGTKSLVSSGRHHIPIKPNESLELRRERLSEREEKRRYSFLEIAYDVDTFKQIKEMHQLTHGVDYFYPVDEEKLQDLKKLVRYPG